MSKAITLTFIAAVVVALSALVFAMPHDRRLGATGGDISMIECQDKECRVGCRTISKIPEDVCHSPPFRHNDGMKAICSLAPSTELCYYFGIFKKNGTSAADYCTDANAEMTMYHQCNQCRETHFRKGSYEKTTGCSSSTTLTLNFECDSTCTTCNKTHALTEKTCTVPAGFPNAIEVSAPTRCGRSIQYFEYNNSQCSGTGNQGETAFAGACYGMFGRSHMYQCA